MKPLNQLLLVMAFCTLASGQALAVSVKHYCEMTSNMQHKLDWRIYEPVRDVLGMVGGTEIPQVNACYRAANIEAETRKVYDGAEHELKRARMTGTSVATHKATNVHALPSSFVREVPDHEYNPVAYDKFIYAAQQGLTFSLSDLTGEPTTGEPIVLVSATAMQAINTWCTSSDSLGEVSDLGSQALLQYFGNDEELPNLGYDHVLDLLVGPQNQNPDDPGNLIERGRATQSLTDFVDVGAILEDTLEALDVDSIPGLKVDSEQSVYRYPVVMELANSEFKGCVSGDTWDEMRDSGHPHWPQRWCFRKYKEEDTYLDLPRHSMETPICECIEEFDTFDIPNTNERGVKLDPWGMMVASITDNQFQSDWVIEYEMYAEDPNLVRVLANVPGRGLTGYLPLVEQGNSPNTYRGEISLREALALGDDDLDPLFGIAYSVHNPGQVVLFAASQNANGNNAHILNVKVVPATDKSERLYCSSKRLVHNEDDRTRRVTHSSTSGLTFGVGSSVDSWIVSADDDDQQIAIGNQATLHLGGVDIRSAGTGSEVLYDFADPNLMSGSDAMGYESMSRISMEFPLYEMGLFRAEFGGVSYMTRDEGSSPRSSGTLESFSFGQENWLASTFQLGGTISGEVDFRDYATVKLSGDLTVGSTAKAQAETTIHSFDQPRMVQDSHQELGVTGWRRIWGWRIPIFGWVTVLDDVAPAEEQQMFDTITAQNSSSNQSDAILAFNLLLQFELPYGLSLPDLQLLDLVFHRPLSDGYSHGSMMLTNQRDYVHASGERMSYEFNDPMTSYNAMACVDGNNSATSMRSVYDNNGNIVQEAMSENAMLACQNGDVAPYRPEPNDPSDPGDLIAGWINTLDDILDQEAEFYCVKDYGELVNLHAVPEDLIFKNPALEVDPTITDKWCTIVFRDSDGNILFPTEEAREARDQICILSDVETCPEDICEVRTYSLGEHGEEERCVPVD